MEFQKSKTLLEKINALYKNISNDPRNVSSIERDLMKSYIQQFYEAFLEMPTVAAAVAPAPPPVEAKPAEPRITLRKPETAPAPPKPEPPKEEPPQVEIPRFEKMPEPAPVPPPPPIHPPVATPPPAPVVEKPVEAPAPLPEKTVEFQPAPPPRPSHNTDPELEALFAFKTATELSEKLSQAPITDIKKAMGLNDRISTQNELFGGDNAAFDATVATLNQLRSYEDAKDYLIRNVAQKYNWASKERKEKAKEFIKLVRRRY
jgi:hypothetical protein